MPGDVMSEATRALTLTQEYGECMNDTPTGMKIHFDEKNMTKWEVLMDGPEQSVYAVRWEGSMRDRPRDDERKAEVC